MVSTIVRTGSKSEGRMSDAAMEERNAMDINSRWMLRRRVRSATARDRETVRKRGARRCGG